jgi:hypothetical protein
VSRLLCYDVMHQDETGKLDFQGQVWRLPHRVGTCSTIVHVRKFVRRWVGQVQVIPGKLAAWVLLCCHAYRW